MTNNVKLKYFIPDKITVGIFHKPCILSNVLTGNLSFDFGFVTCIFKYDGWVSSPVFERLTGYRPGNMRDSTAQLKKLISGVSQELENIPTDGFKLVGFDSNPYRFIAGDQNNILIEDPRGFTVAVSRASFFKTLSLINGNMSEFKLSGQFSYGWDHDGKTLTLIPVSCGEYTEWKAESDKYKEKKKNPITKKTLIEGHVYHSSNNKYGGDWMYMGIHNTYSGKCHLAAYQNNGVYDVDTFIDNERGKQLNWNIVWPTTTGRMIFYSMKTRDQQYIVKSDINKFFDFEVLPKRDGKFCDCNDIEYKMFDNPDIPVTFDAVKDEMSRNVAFEKILFDSCKCKTLVQMPKDSFLTCIEHQYSTCLSLFPFQWAEALYQTNDNFIRVSVSSMFNNKTEYTFNDSFKYGTFLRSRTINHIQTTDELYSRVAPTYFPYELESGKTIKPEHAVLFVPDAVLNYYRNSSSYW